MSLPIGRIGDMEEEKPEEGSRAASLAAMLKGFLPKLSVEDFPVEPEKACQKLPVLLPLWLKEKVTKPEARTALRLAAPRIGTESREEILNHSGSYRKFLVKKRGNMKTGEKTDPHVLHVLKQMQHGMASGSKPEMAVKALQPAKRLRVKTPQKEACQQPGMAESSGKASSSKPKILIAVCDGSAASDGNSASGGSVANDGSAASDGSAAIAASSDVDFFRDLFYFWRRNHSRGIEKARNGSKKASSLQASQSKRQFGETICDDGPSQFLGGFLQFWSGEGNKSKFQSLYSSQEWHHRQALLLGECILAQRSRAKPGHGWADGRSLQGRLDKRQIGRIQKFLAEKVGLKSHKWLRPRKSLQWLYKSQRWHSWKSLSWDASPLNFWRGNQKPEMAPSGILDPQIVGWEMKSQRYFKNNWYTSPSNFWMGNEKPEMAPKQLVYFTLKFLDVKWKARGGKKQLVYFTRKFLDGKWNARGGSKKTGALHPQIFRWEMKSQRWLKKNWYTWPSNFWMGNQKPVFWWR